MIDPVLVCVKKKGEKEKTPLRFVYLHCIPTVVQAAEREMERREEEEEEEVEGGGCCSEKNDAAAVLGGCRLGRDREGERGRREGGKEGGLLSPRCAWDLKNTED
ncbi:hypothetical protein PAMP_010309 [Pampus punctatissimus]